MKMETMYNNHFFIEANSDKKHMETVKKLSTGDLTDDEYKTEVLAWAKIVETIKPVTQLVDERDMRYKILPDMQIWINENLIAVAIKNGLKKAAFLVSDELFSQVSVEQTLDRRKSKTLQVEYFDSRDEAQKWLASK